MICLRGRWGVGKTYLWDAALRDAKTNKRIPDRYYSYVSLFGLGGLNDLKHAIFENTIPPDLIGRTLTIEDIGNSAVASAPVFTRVITKLLPFAGQSGLAEAVKRLSFIYVRNMLVCFDDIDRRSEDLNIKDVFGLASLLKEERNCKVLIIANEQRLTDDDRAEFNTHLEKVADRHLIYSPTAQEAAEIAVPGINRPDGELRDRFITLGVSNIRIIKRAARIVSEIGPLLADYDEQVLSQAIATVALLVWCKYGEGDRPDIDYLRRFNMFSEPKDEKERTWIALMHQYGFGQLDEFDRAVLRSIEQGYPETDAIVRGGAALDKLAKNQKLDRQFSRAWDLYHDTFAANEDELANELYKATCSSLSVVTPNNLNSTVSLLKELKRNDEALDIIDRYVKERKEEPELFDLNNDVFGHLSDPDVRAAFAKQSESYVDSRSPADTLLHIAKSSGWSSGEIDLLLKLSVDDFVKLFEENSGPNLTRLVRAALKFKSIVGADKEKPISERAEDALRKIGKKSALNRRRVAKFGVTL